MSEKFFPTCMIVLSVCAALVYLKKGDVRRAIYWAAAATLNTSVTW